MESKGQEETLSSIQALFDSCIAKGVPGISAAIQTSSGEVHHFQAGHADIQAQRPLRQNSPLGIGSITKVFVAVVILQLVEEQRLSLDDDVSSVFGHNGAMDGIPGANQARVRELLSHTSALASWEDDPDWIRDGRGENSPPGNVWWLKNKTLEYLKPDANEGLKKGEFHYANTNYTLLGLIIERATSGIAVDEIRKRIMEPLELVSTYFDSFQKVPLHIGNEDVPRRYHWATPQFRKTAGISPHFKPIPDRDDLIDVTNSNLTVSWTAGGIISTPCDLLKFANALQKPKEQGGLLSAKSLQTLMEWHHVDEKQEMGHGIFRLRDGNDTLWIGHNGGVLGFSAAWWSTLDAKDRSESKSRCTVAILCNVGTSHSGPVPASAVHDPARMEILELAAKL